jgi:hypothetical protein
MKETGQSLQDILFYKDLYDEESAKVAEELKLQEQKIMKQMTNSTTDSKDKIR